MTTKAERIAELKAEIARLEAERRPQTRWKPEDGEEFWVACSDGSIDSDAWANHGLYEAIFAQGNVFKTEEEAMAYAEHLEAVTACNDAAMQSWADAGEVLDWENSEQRKSALYYNRSKKGFGTITEMDIQFFNTHPFATHESALTFAQNYSKPHRLFWQYGDV